MCLSVCVCVESAPICANQPKTNALLHSSFAFKILLLVPLVWILDHTLQEQPQNSVSGVDLEMCVCVCVDAEGGLGGGIYRRLPV